MNKLTPPQRIQKIIEHLDLTIDDFGQDINKGRAQSVYDIVNGKTKSITQNMVNKIRGVFPQFNEVWLLTGTGEMLNDKPEQSKEEIPTSKRNLIPLYEDVATIGGTDTVANIDPVKASSIQIDAGDWFRGATAAIRHYGDSMTEYSSGCILAIRELNNKNEIVWGRNYVVETDERRITKQIAELDEHNIICYSTNTEKHPDGRLKHQPIIIPKQDIRYISRVLGSVNKEESTGKVQLL